MRFMQLVKKHKSTTFSVNDCLPFPTYIIISFMHEVCAAKNMSFRIVVVLIPMKRRIGGQGVANPSFSMTTIKVFTVLKCNLQPSQIILHSWCHTKRRVGRAPPTNPSFAMTTNKIFKDAFLWHTLHVLDLHGSACHASVTLIMFSHARHFAEPSRQLDVVIIFTNNFWFVPHVKGYGTAFQWTKIDFSPVSI